MTPNKEQAYAIQKIKGQAVLIACPGSGKTTTLLKRISYMTEHGVNPENILMVTFTKAAADEMRKRFKRDYPEVSGVTFSTIHAFCFAVLRKFAGDNERKNLVNPVDVTTFFVDMLKRENSGIIDRGEFINVLKTDISVVKNSMMEPDEYEPKCGDADLFVKLYTEYEEWKNMTNQIDYDDMLLMAYDLMQNDETCITWLQNRYKYIQVDEYQDINQLQKCIIYLLAGKNGNIMVVGDDDQSIYGFRGASPQIMLNFKKDYPDAEEIRMSTNYRSGMQIIKTADRLIKNNKIRFQKEFLSKKPEDGEIIPLATRAPETSYLEMIKKIQTKHEAGIPLEEMAVLYRINTQATAISDYFLKAGIDFTSNEVIQSKYDHWIFRDVECYRKVASGNFSKAEFNLILNHPNRFLYGKAFYRAEMSMKGLMTAAQTLAGWKRDNAYENICSLYYILEKFKVCSPYESLKALEDHGKYKDFLKEYNSKRKLEENELTQIWDLILQEAKEYPTWEQWEVHIAENRYMLKEKIKTKTGVMLSTMHRSKGLEWSCVHIADCVDGRIPSGKAESDKDIEEERRLFYVAITRAKKNLYLYTYGPKNKRSPFLKELGVPVQENYDGESGGTRRYHGSSRTEKIAGNTTKYYETDSDEEYTPQRIYRIGESICHTKYGSGIILDVTRRSLKVQFAYGVKTLDIQTCEKNRTLI